MNRDLNKYLNQLRRAKIVCERRITANGGRSYLVVDASANKNSLANRTVCFYFSKYDLILFYHILLDAFIKYDIKLYYWSSLFTSIFRKLRHSCIS